MKRIATHTHTRARSAMSATAAASVQQKQRKKIASLEATVDTCIIAYESHRNALENICAQLAQWQQPPDEGCIHLSASESNELINDINDVLEQCALQLPAMDEASTSAVDTPLRSQQQRDARQPSQSSADGTRPTSLHPAASTASSSSRQARPQPTPNPAAPPAAEPTNTRSSRCNRAVPAPADPAEPTPAAASTAASLVSPPASDVARPSRTRRAEHAQPPHTPPQQLQPNAAPQYHSAPTAPAPPPAQPQQQQQQQAQPQQARSTRRERTPASTTALAPSAEPNLGSPAQLDKTAQKPGRTGTPDASYSAAPSTPTPPPSQEPSTALLSRDSPPRRTRAATPPSAERTQQSDLLSSRPSASTSARRRGRDRTGVALSPWPLPEDGGSATRQQQQQQSPGSTPPSARQRALEHHDELPAPQYAIFKETGQPLRPSPERRAAATELEERAKAERDARENGACAELFGSLSRSAATDRSYPASDARRQPRGDAPGVGGMQPRSASSAGSGSRSRDHSQGPPPPPQQQQLSATSSVARSQRSNVASHRAEETPLSHPLYAQPAAAAASESGRSASRHSHAASSASAPRRPPSTAASASVHSYHSQQPHAQHHTGEDDEDEPLQSFSASRATSQASSVARAHRAAAPAAVMAERPASMSAAPAGAPSSAAASTASSSVPRRLRPPREAPAEASTAAASPGSHADSAGLVYTPTATPQRDSAASANGNGAAPHPEHHVPASAAARSLPPPAQPPLPPGEPRPLRTSTPRRTTPKAYDSTQVQDAVYHRRLPAAAGPQRRQSVRADGPEALQYMAREDAVLGERRDRELEEVHRDPRLAIGGADADAAPLSITAGPGGQLTVRGGGSAAARRSGAADAAAAPPTAVEAQLTAERAALLTQLEKMQMEMSIAVSRHREWGNERRYTQLNTRMTRVMQDLDRVETELRVIRNFDLKSRSQSIANAV